MIRWMKGEMGKATFNKGKSYQAAEQFDEAVCAFEDAERYLGQHYGEGHIWTRQAVAQRAWCLARLGRAAEAAPLYECALADERRLRGDTEWSRTLEQQLAWARRRQ